MQIIHCDIHNIDIKIYDKEDELYFKDDNSPEVSVFSNGDKKYLKRFVRGLCDENCETIKNILK